MAQRMETVYPNLAAVAGGQSTGEQTSVLNQAAPPAEPQKTGGGGRLNPALAVVILLGIALFGLLPWK